jgi:hypothetical protein
MQATAKQERIIEAVRQGLQGDAAVEFVCRNGYAMNTAAIARHLRSMGGRGRIQELVGQGFSNLEILKTCFPNLDIDSIPFAPPRQEELFADSAPVAEDADSDTEDAPLYETAKLTLRVPSDLYEAIRFAARAENKTQGQLIVDILASALSRMPEPPSE